MTFSEHLQSYAAGLNLICVPMNARGRIAGAPLDDGGVWSHLQSSVDLCLGGKILVGGQRWQLDKCTLISSSQIMLNLRASNHYSW